MEKTITKTGINGTFKGIIWIKENVNEKPMYDNSSKHSYDEINLILGDLIYHSLLSNNKNLKQYK